MEKIRTYYGNNPQGGLLSPKRFLVHICPVFLPRYFRYEISKSICTKLQFNFHFLNTSSVKIALPLNSDQRDGSFGRCAFLVQLFVSLCDGNKWL